MTHYQDIIYLLRTKAVLHFSEFRYAAEPVLKGHPIFPNTYSNISIFFLLQIDLRTSGQTVVLTSPM
jgi:hypothetical protein